MTRGAFTIVEVTVVLLVVALAAAAVTLRMRPALAGIERSEALSQVRAFDRLTRTQARELDRPLRLVVDLAGARLLRMDEEGLQTAGLPLELPRGYAVERVLVAREEAGWGRVTIACSRRGLTPTYALLLRDGAGRRQWLVVAGLSGQVKVVEDEREAKELLASLESGGDAR